LLTAFAANLTVPPAPTDQAACCALTDFAGYFATIAMLWSWRYTAGWQLKFYDLSHMTYGRHPGAGMVRHARPPGV